MTPFLQLLLALIFLLLAAKLSGLLAIRLHQPSVLGELLAGILFGPSLFHLLAWPVFADSGALEHILVELGEIGVLLLMFIAGLELHLSELRGNAKVAGLAGTLGVLLPLLTGWLTGLAFGMEQSAAIFLGLVMGATSVSISAQTLMELNALKTRVGLGLLGAAVFDDILAIFFLSAFFALTSGAGGLAEIFWVFARMALFFALAFGFGLWLLPRLVRVTRNAPISQGVLTLALVTIFGYGLAAEWIGQMAAITGAFLAGLMFARTPEKETLTPRVAALAYGFFVPLFFVGIGLKTKIPLGAETLLFSAAVILVAVLAKWIGVGAGARLAGFSWRESIQLGMGMVSRGEVGLIVASAGARAGLVTEAEFAAVVAMVIASTLITPPALRALFQLPEDWSPPVPRFPKWARPQPKKTSPPPAPAEESAAPEEQL
ncbi:MAG: cation:proton antiporter [Anaerolineales bacterium]